MSKVKVVLGPIFSGSDMPAFRKAVVAAFRKGGRVLAAVCNDLADLGADSIEEMVIGGYAVAQAALMSDVSADWAVYLQPCGLETPTLDPTFKFAALYCSIVRKDRLVLAQFAPLVPPGGITMPEQKDAFLKELREGLETARLLPSGHTKNEKRSAFLMVQYLADAVNDFLALKSKSLERNPADFPGDSVLTVAVDGKWSDGHSGMLTSLLVTDAYASLGGLPECIRVIPVRVGSDMAQWEGDWPTTFKAQIGALGLLIHRDASLVLASAPKAELGIAMGLVPISPDGETRLAVAVMVDRWGYRFIGTYPALSVREDGSTGLYKAASCSISHGNHPLLQEMLEYEGEDRPSEIMGALQAALAAYSTFNTIEAAA